MSMQLSNSIKNNIWWKLWYSHACVTLSAAHTHTHTFEDDYHESWSVREGYWFEGNTVHSFRMFAYISISNYKVPNKNEFLAPPLRVPPPLLTSPHIKSVLAWTWKDWETMYTSQVSLNGICGISKNWSI